MMLGQAWITRLTFLCGAILIVGKFGVAGTPSQLRLSHSGYEIISFNDEDPVASGSLGSPRIGVKNCTSTGVEEDSTLSRVNISLSENRSGHGITRSGRGSKIGRDSRPNRIDVGQKGASSTGSAKSSGVYLTLGIPGRLVRGENPQKVSPSSVGIWDESKNGDSSGNHEEFVAALIETKVGDEKREDRAKTSPKFEPVPEDPKDFDRVDDESSKSQESDQLLPAKLPIADLIRDVPIEKLGTPRKINRFGATGTKTILSKISKFPSIRIHHPGTYWPPAATPAILSPVYPALGFEIPRDLDPKAIIPLVPNEPKCLEAGSKSSGKKVVSPESRWDTLDLEPNEVGAQSGDARRSIIERLPTFMLIDGGKHEDPMLRTVNRLSLDLADLVPFSGASFDVLTLGPKNGRSSEGQRDDSDQIITTGKPRAGPDDYDSTDPDARFNHRSFGNVSRDPTGYQSDESNVTPTVPNLLVNVAHVHETPRIAANKSGTPKKVENPRNAPRLRESKAARAKYKKPRNPGVPSFYQFVTKFTDLVLENALRYETRGVIQPEVGQPENLLTGSGAA